MRSILPFAVILLFGLAVGARAVEYTPESFSGVWRIDLERTRALYGAEAARKMADNMKKLVEMRLSGAGDGTAGGTLRSYALADDNQTDRTPVAVQAGIVDGALLLCIEGDTLLSLQILDADSLEVCEEEKCGVLVRIAPKSNR